MNYCSNNNQVAPGRKEHLPNETPAGCLVRVVMLKTLTSSLRPELKKYGVLFSNTLTDSMNTPHFEVVVGALENYIVPEKYLLFREMVSPFKLAHTSTTDVVVRSFIDSCKIYWPSPEVELALEVKNYGLSLNLMKKLIEEDQEASEELSSLPNVNMLELEVIEILLLAL